MKSSEFSAAILCGGKSSRMGRDKAMLPYGGGTMISYQIKKFKRLGAKQIMLSGEGRKYPGTETVADILPDCGPLAGICSCLKESKCEVCLFSPVDSPLVPMELLFLLVKCCGERGIMAKHGDEAEPLLCAVNSSCAAELEEMLKNGEKSVRKALEKLGCGYLLRQDDGSFFNCNTPEDYKKISE